MEEPREEENTEQNQSPLDYVTETQNFRNEASLSIEIQEERKRRALAKCQDLHNILLDCYEKKHFCGSKEKDFWDCYRNERGFKKSKVTAWTYNFYHGVVFGNKSKENQTKENE